MVTFCGSEGNPWSGVALAMHYRLSYNNTCRLEPKKGRSVNTLCVLMTPRMGPGHSLPPCALTFSFFNSFLLFPFLFSYLLYLFLLSSIPSLSTRIVPLCFQAGGRSKRPNLGLVCLCLFCIICIS